MPWAHAALLLISALEPLLGTEPLSVEADRLIASGKENQYVAEGNAIVRRGPFVLLADRVTFDKAAKTMLAEGHVTVIEPTHVLTCTKVEMRLPDLAGGLEGAELHIKAPIAPEVLASMSAKKLVHFGKDELIVTGGEIDRRSKKKFEIDSASITACDCGEGNKPTWSIDSSHAWVDLDSGAWLLFPVFYAKDTVPVLVLPAFYVPLGSRRSGLLIPRINGLGLPDNAVTGLRLYQPLYLVLGDSWDATLEPGYMTRRGWAGEAELRWAPDVDAKGELHLQTLFDHGRRSPQPGNTFSGEYHLSGHGIVADRFALNVRHDERFSAGRLVADVNLVSDPVYLFEFIDLFLQRQAESTMSRMTFTSPACEDSTLRAAGGIFFMQDLRTVRYHNTDITNPFDARTVRLISADANGPGDVRERFASLRLDAAPYPIGQKDSPLLGEARLVADVFAAPLSEIARFARADFRPALTLPIHLFDLAVLQPELIARFTGWSGSANGVATSESRFAAIGKLSLFTEIGRSFGDFAHRIRPELRYLFIPHVERRGDGVFETMDEIDLLRPVQQASLRLATDFWETKTGRRIGGAEAWIGRDLGFPAGIGDTFGQNVPLAALGTSELVLKGDVEVRPFDLPFATKLDARTALDTHTHALVELLGGLTFAFTSGDALTVLYGRFKDQVPLNSFLATEELVPSRTFTADRYVAPSAYGPLVYGNPAGSSVQIPISDWRSLLLSHQLDWSFWGSYDAVFISTAFRPVKELFLGFDVTLSPYTDANGNTYSPIRNTRTTIRWDSDCDCFGLGLTGVTDRYQVAKNGIPGLNFLFLISLGRLGEVRSGQ